jgi:hypothetical protein
MYCRKQAESICVDANASPQRRADLKRQGGSIRHRWGASDARVQGWRSSLVMSFRADIERHVAFPKVPTTFPRVTKI